MKVFKSTETEIWFNLALEAYLLNKYGKTEPFVYLWQNDKCIVIGKYQNPHAECDLASCSKDGVKIARRNSGGGAVFQDLGNACFTFSSPALSASKSENFECVIRALGELGLKAELSGRNDILVEGKKVSGSAFEMNKDYFAHHATMLVNANLQGVAKYLTPNSVKLQSKGIKSVASRVANLCDFDDDITVSEFYDVLCKQFEDQKVEVFSKEVLLGDKEFVKLYQKFCAREWNIDQSPKFTQKIEVLCKMGILSVYFEVSKGVVEGVRVFSDTLESGVVEELEAKIKGTSFTKDAFLGLYSENYLVSDALFRLADKLDV